MTVDPRSNPLKKTANEIIADRAIRHAVYLERFKSGQVNELMKLFNAQLEPELITLLQTNLDGLKLNTKRYKKLTEGIAKIYQEQFEDYFDKLEADMDNFSLLESKWELSAMQKAAPIKLDFILPSPETLKAIITQKPMQGALVKDWFDDLSKRAAKNVNREITMGIVNGNSTEEIVRRIKGTKAANYGDGILNRDRREIRAMVRTSVNHVSSNTREALYSANDDVIKGVQIVATLDDRTSEICIAMDGKVFEVGEGPRPPFHINCRTTTVPVLKSWKELGINLKEAPDGTRASMDGQVSATWTYDDWLKTQSKEDQNEILGVGKAELFRTGKIRAKDLIDQNYQPVSLKKLKEKIAKG